jgi:hypothetical protein
MRLTEYVEWNNQTGVETKREWVHNRFMPGDNPHAPVPIPIEDADFPIVGLCDFCGGGLPAWEFPAHDFFSAAEPTDLGSIDAWQACDICKRFIDSNRWGEVAKRWAAVEYPGVPPERTRARRAEIMKLHQEFVQARTGPPKPV